MSGFLTANEIAYWRRTLGSIEGWEATHPWGTRARELVAKLDPPFIPENEAIGFDPGVGSNTIGITEVSYKNVTLKNGFFLATESRLIAGNDKQAVAFQVPYPTIKAVYAQNDIYTLVLADDSNLTIKTKVPGASVSGALLILGGSPDSGNIARTEQAKAATAQDFRTAFSGFFSEIVDQNRALRESSGPGAIAPNVPNLQPATPDVTPSSSEALSPQKLSERPTQPPVVGAVGMTVGQGAAPVTVATPFYRSTGCLVLSFLFFTPLWSLLILTDSESSKGAKIIAAILLTIAIIFLLSLLSRR